MTPYEVAQRVVQSHQHEQGLDAQTAQLLIQVYEALNPTNKAHMDTMSVARAGTLAWKIYAKSKGA